MKTSINILRWISRIISAIIIVFFLYMFIGETIGDYQSGKSQAVSNHDLLQLILMGIGLIGLGLGWIWELAGGIIALIAFVWIGIVNPRTIPFPMLIFMIPAVLFLIAWSWDTMSSKNKVNMNSIN